MSKRDAYLSALEESKKNTLNNIQEKSNAVDETINEFERAISAPAPEPKKTVSSSVKLGEGISLNFKQKENKTVHKNFVIPKSINDKLTALSKSTGVSENEIVNEIFRKVFVENNA